MSALTVNALQIVRRPARHDRRQSQCRTGRAPADHRTERRWQDHIVQPDHRRTYARFRLDPTVRPGHHPCTEPPPRPSRHGAHLSDHHFVRARYHLHNVTLALLGLSPSRWNPLIDLKRQGHFVEHAQAALQRVGPRAHREPAACRRPPMASAVASKSPWR